MLEQPITEKDIGKRYQDRRGEIYHIEDVRIGIVSGVIIENGLEVGRRYFESNGKCRSEKPYFDLVREYHDIPSDSSKLDKVIHDIQQILAILRGRR